MFIYQVQGLFTEGYGYNTVFPGDSDDKESACNAGDPDSIRGSGRFPGMSTHSRIIAYICAH